MREYLHLAGYSAHINSLSHPEAHYEGRGEEGAVINRVITT